MIPYESTIEGNILKYLNGLPHTKAVKWSQDGRQQGNPDIICGHRGLMLLFEVKRPGENPSLLQSTTIQEWREAGVIAEVVYSVDDVKRTMEMVGRVRGVSVSQVGT